MSKLASTIRKALITRPTPAAHAVHLHGGAQGAYVCDNARCSSPALDPADA